MSTAVLIISLLFKTYPNCQVGIDEFSRAPIDPKDSFSLISISVLYLESHYLIEATNLSQRLQLFYLFHLAFSRANFN